MCPWDGVAMWEILSWRVRGVADDCVLGSQGYAWQYRGPYGASTGTARQYWGVVQWEYYGVTRRYSGVPLTPLTAHGECRGIPWPREQTRGTVPQGMYIVQPVDLGLAIAVVRALAGHRWQRQHGGLALWPGGGAARPRSTAYEVASIYV